MSLDAAYAAARKMIDAIGPIKGLRVEPAPPFRRHQGDKFVSIYERDQEPLGVSLTVGLKAGRVVTGEGLSFDERKRLEALAKQIANRLGLEAYSRPGDHRLYITFVTQTLPAPVTRGFMTRLTASDREVVGGLAPSRWQDDGTMLTLGIVALLAAAGMALR